MGAHLIDHPFWALGLSVPSSIEATSTPWGTTQGKPVSFPLSTCVHYRFAARGAQPPVKLSWFDGGIYPPRPDLLPDDVELRSEGGVIFLGEKGILLHDTYGARPRLYPQALSEAAAAIPQSIPRIGDPRRGEGKLPDRVRRAAHRDHAARYGRTASGTGEEDSLRRRARTGHQCRRRKPILDSRLSRRMGYLNHVQFLLGLRQFCRNRFLDRQSLDGLSRTGTKAGQ
jgi:hypothetical protein